MEDNKEKAPSDVEDNKEPDEAICSTLGNTEVLQTKSEIIITCSRNNNHQTS